MLFNTQMVGASRIRYLPAVPCKRFRQATTRSLGRSNGGGLILSFSFSLVGFWTTVRGGTVEAVVKATIMMMTMTGDVY
jgi:hypothetical protein